MALREQYHNAQCLASRECCTQGQTRCFTRVSGGAADPSGRPAIAHGSRVKVRLQHPGGWWVDRVPAWIRWATVEANKMGAKYDGIHWDPPQDERHTWCVVLPRGAPTTSSVVLPLSTGHAPHLEHGLTHFLNAASPCCSTGLLA